jgi:hypothetical protein
MDTPNRYPMRAVNNMANVPQNVILTTLFQTLDPPVLAVTAPKKARNRIEKEY